MSCTVGDVPDPIETFDDKFMHERLQENVSRANFAKPTPVQKYAIPIGEVDCEFVRTVFNVRQALLVEM